MLMGTVVEIQVLDEDADRYSDAVTAAFAEMARVEQLMSPHFSDSDVSRLAGSEQAVIFAAETVEVLKLAQNISAVSDGVFDVTIGRLIELWGFAEGEPGLPEPEMIETALSGAGPENIKIDGNQIIKLSSGVALDLGGIAKGYAIDRAIEILRHAGVRHASVNAGGDMRLLGDRVGALWRIGIQHPRQVGNILAKIELADRAIVTSGDYERYFEQDGVRYHHLLDPRTGYPARDCQAVTVIADTAASADALATAVFVLGPEQGIALLQNTPQAEGLIVAADGSVAMTPGLRESILWP